MTVVNKQDSNNTGLRYCEEASLGVLPATASQAWYPAEPNSYSDFGGQIKTVARNPINSSRQNQKGVTVDLDASGGWNSDITKTNALRFMQGFMFADWREPYDTQSINDGTFAIGSVTGSTHKYAGDDMGASGAVIANHLLLASGFSVSGNNGVKVVSSVTEEVSDGEVLDAEVTTAGSYAADPTDTDVGVTGGSGTGALFDVTGTGGGPYTVSAIALGSSGGTGYVAGDVLTLDNDGGSDTLATITVTEVADGQIKEITLASGLADETPAATARLQVVGYQFASATLDVSVSSSLPRLVRASGAFDFTTLGLVPGQFIYVGGDAAGTKFATTSGINNGWARVHSVAATYIELDKTTSTMVAETGTGLTVQIFFGKVLKNESDTSLIKRRSFQLERDLGQADTSLSAHQGEYLVGAVANEFTLNVKQADKINADMTFVATDNEQRAQSAGGLKSALAAAGGGSAPALVSEDAYNTSNHVSRLRMTVPTSTNANPTPLFAYLTEFTLVINNNVQPNKAVSVLGAFDLTAGQFDVSGKVTAYFADVAAVQAVRDNEDVSLDFALARDNFGILFDVPLVALGDGRLSVEQNNPITLPLDMNAAADRTFDHTLLVEFFPYLPDAAM